MREACPYCLAWFDGDDAEDRLDTHIFVIHESSDDV